MFFRLIFFLGIIIMNTGVFAQTGGNSCFEKQAAIIAASMDDGTMAAQVLLAGIDGRLSLSPAMRLLLEKAPAGGIMLFGYNLDSPKADVKKLLSETSNLVALGAGIPPFMAVDHEGGLVHRFGPGVERLPSAFSFWELAQREGRDAAMARAESLYRRSAREIRELGITMVLGPVAETLNAENRFFLETRSFGPDPDFITAAATVYVKSMDAEGIASAVKHFPGNSSADPHIGLPSLTAGKAALDEMVRPFREIFRCLEVPAVMLSHVMVPALDDKKNASLSGPVIEGWLRGELGFTGIVITDDFSMGAISASGLSPAAAAVEALNAGVDMIMVWPKDLSAVHASILEAIRLGRLSRERLLQAAGRVIAAKIRYGLVE